MHTHISLEISYVFICLYLFITADCVTILFVLMLWQFQSCKMLRRLLLSSEWSNSSLICRLGLRANAGSKWQIITYLLKYYFTYYEVVEIRSRYYIYCLLLTGDIEYHVLVSSGRAGQVTSVDASVAFLGSAYDEHGQSAVVRPVDTVSTVRHDQSLAAGDGTCIDRYSVDVGRRGSGPSHAPWRRVSAAARVTIPVDLHKVVMRVEPFLPFAILRFPTLTDLTLDPRGLAKTTSLLPHYCIMSVPN